MLYASSLRENNDARGLNTKRLKRLNETIFKKRIKPVNVVVHVYFFDRAEHETSAWE